MEIDVRVSATEDVTSPVTRIRAVSVARGGAVVIFVGPLIGPRGRSKSKVIHVLDSQAYDSCLTVNTLNVSTATRNRDYSTTYVLREQRPVSSINS